MTKLKNLVLDLENISVDENFSPPTLSYFTNFRHTKKRQSVKVVGLCRRMTVKMRSILTFDYSLFDKFVEQVPPKWHLKIGFIGSLQKFKMDRYTTRSHQI